MYYLRGCFDITRRFAPVILFIIIIKLIFAPITSSSQNTETKPTIEPSKIQNNRDKLESENTGSVNLDPAKKIALVIGNKEYNVTPKIPSLENPVNDANEMADTLEDLGFEVIKKNDLSKDETIEALDEFYKRILAQDVRVALFYYSGHGLQYQGNNYLIPVTSIIDRNAHIKRYGVNFQELLNRLENAEAQINILIFDACRNLPKFQSTRGFLEDYDMGLAQITTSAASFIAYSTSPGEVAYDGLGDNSPFTEELLKWIREPGLTIEQVFKRVRRDVMRKTDNAQRPWDLSSLIEEFYFISPDKSNGDVREKDKFDEAYAFFNVGLKQSENTKIDDAIDTFTKVIEISPDYSEAYKERGTLYFRLKEYNKSIDDLDKAIELRPDFTAAYNNRGIVYSILGEYLTAQENFDEAINIDKSFLKSYNNKARLFQIQGENEKALEVYADALKINPNYAPVYNNRGLLYFSEKRYQKAVQDFTFAIENQRNFANAYHNRGVTYYYIEEYEKALKDYNEAITLDPDKFKYYKDRAFLYEEMGLKDKAKSDRETAERLSGGK